MRREKKVITTMIILEMTGKKRQEMPNIDLGLETLLRLLKLLVFMQEEIVLGCTKKKKLFLFKKKNFFLRIIETFC